METKQELRLGYAAADITPLETVEMIGFGRADERSRGVLHPLMAQVSVWTLGTERCCLIAVDHIGFSRQHADALRAAVGARINAARERVMLCFSHTHAAPNDSANTAYFPFASERILGAVERALASMESVRVCWGNGTAEIGLNRRVSSDALDRRLGVCKVCDASSGALRLLLLRLTAHANVLKADNYLLSPDYFGTVRDVLTAEYGCPVMVTQGACGNVAPRFFRSALTPPDACDERFIRSDTALADMAKRVADGVRAVLPALVPKRTGRLSMTSDTVTLYADVPDGPLARKTAEDARRMCGIDGTAWLAEVERLHENGVTSQQETVEVQYFALGDGCLCGVPNEIMCEFALRTSAILHDELFYFGGYTNGCTGYFPTEAEFDEGGYEVYWSMLVFFMYHGRVFPLRRNAAAELIGFAAAHAPEKA